MCKSLRVALGTAGVYLVAVSLPAKNNSQAGFKREKEFV
jgi:hypothetical protein